MVQVQVSAALPPGNNLNSYFLGKDCAGTSSGLYVVGL